MEPDFSLDPGKEYPYSHNREFSAPGQYEFRPHYHKQDGSEWVDVPPDGWTNIITITIESLPEVKGVAVEPQKINQGDAFVVKVIASDYSGVQSIQWWSEGTGDDYLNRGGEASCGGVTWCEHSWPLLTWTGKDGEFPIYAKAHDTAGFSSRVMSTTITVAARFSFSIGGGSFDNKSVETAMGFAINWAVLQEEVGEVVLVDFLSREILAGPTKPVYDPDWAKELLAGAGYSGGFDAVLLFDSADKPAAGLADLVASYLSRVGIGSKYLWVAQDNARTEFSARIAAGKSCLLIERR